MWAGVAVVLGGSILAGATLKGLSWGRRQRMIRTVDPESIVRQVRGASLRVLVEGPAALPSMSRSKANRTVGDVLVTADRLLVVCGRGTLVDIRPGKGRPLGSVRSPGPGRLVMEGTVPAASGPDGSFRIELVVDDAPGWVEALAPFRDADNGGYGGARQSA
ncbi:MAG: hypothetical protein H6734_03895 [Alphaproteobacteria bacterium]|nr:hypothetical protein [Alphaproteobacteria bacterium]